MKALKLAGTLEAIEKAETVKMALADKTSWGVSARSFLKKPVALHKVQVNLASVPSELEKHGSPRARAASLRFEQIGAYWKRRVCHARGKIYGAAARAEN